MGQTHNGESRQEPRDLRGVTKIKVDLTQTYVCAKCGSPREVVRHHMGFDSFVGRFNNKIGRQYAQYNDCVNLCELCHMYIHYNYKPIIQRHMDYSPRGVLRLRTKLIHYCKQWLAGKIKGRKPSKDFIEQWQIGSRAWRLRQNARQRR